MAKFENHEMRSVSVKIGVTAEPSDEFSDVARSLGFVRVVPCFDCAYHDERGYMPGRVTCRMHSGIWGKDDFCSKAEKRKD